MSLQSLSAPESQVARWGQLVHITAPAPPAQQLAEPLADGCRSHVYEMSGRFQKPGSRALLSGAFLAGMPEHQSTQADMGTLACLARPLTPERLHVVEVCLLPLTSLLYTDASGQQILGSLDLASPLPLGSVRRPSA